MKKSFLIVAASLFVCVTAGNVMAQTTDTTKKPTTPVSPTKPATPSPTTPANPTIPTTPAQTTPITPPAPKDAADVVEALNSNPDYTTAALAVKAANLEATLKTGGPYTIFAPNNSAFTKLPSGQLDSLMKDPVKLAALIKGHVVTGHYSKADIIKALTAGKGKAALTTIDGQTLTLSVSKTSTLQLTNAAGSTAEVTLYDLTGGTGIVNGINSVLMPGK